MMEITKVKLCDLVADKNNARKHSKRNIDEIAKSLQYNMQYRPFVVQKSTNRILVGNGMYEAMQKLGWTWGEAYIVDLNDEAATKLALSDNRISELAEWDFEILKDIMQDMGPEPSIPGWTTEELANLFDLTNWEEPKAEEPQEEQKYLLFDKEKIMLSDIEFLYLQQKLDDFKFKNADKTFGFVKWLLDIEEA